MGDAPTDVELVGRARAGDPQAFTALCERSRARLWRIVASVARGPEVEDLAQEAILRAWASLATYRADATFEAWLCRIALNAAHDWRRSAWRRRVLLFPWSRDPGEPASGSPESPESMVGAVARREVMRRVRAAVASLPERQRVPIWLHYFEEFTVAEIARLERTPDTTIRSRMQAGLRRLERQLVDLAECPHQDEVWLAPDKEGCHA